MYKRQQYNLVYGRDGRKVELLPPSLIIDYLDVVDLLDDSFHRSEVAVAYGCLLYTSCVWGRP